MRYASLAVVLFLFWLLLSGFLTPGLMTFGIFSALAAVAVAQLDYADARNNHH